MYLETIIKVKKKNEEKDKENSETTPNLIQKSFYIIFGAMISQS